MSGIPLAHLSEAARQLVFHMHDGFVTPERIRSYYLPRAELRLEQLRVQLNANKWDWMTTQKLTKRIDALEEATSEVFAFISPSYVGGTRGAAGYESGITNEMGLTPCRFAPCTNLVNRHDRWMGGACEECRAIAFDPETGKEETL